MTQCALYRHFDADGRLLYVGISLSAIQRLAQHASSDWSADIRRVDVELYPSREEAAAAEKAAILAENPIHNTLRPAATEKARQVPTRTEDEREAVRSIVAAVGRAKIIDALGRSPGVIGNAIRAGYFPAPWYAVIRDLCAERGVPCPYEAFRWEHSNSRGARNQTAGEAVA